MNGECLLSYKQHHLLVNIKYYTYLKWRLQADRDGSLQINLVVPNRLQVSNFMSYNALLKPEH